MFRFDLLSEYEAHKLRHAVPMIIRRSESVLRHRPARRENDKISHCRTLAKKKENPFFYRYFIKFYSQVLKRGK